MKTTHFLRRLGLLVTVCLASSLPVIAESIDDLVKQLNTESVETYDLDDNPDGKKVEVQFLIWDLNKETGVMKVHTKEPIIDLTKHEVTGYEEGDVIFKMSDINPENNSRKLHLLFTAKKQKKVVEYVDKKGAKKSQYLDLPNGPDETFERLLKIYAH